MGEESGKGAEPANKIVIVVNLLLLLALIVGLVILGYRWLR